MNNYNNVYDAVITAKGIARVHLAYIMNVEHCQAATNLHTKLATLMVHESACRLLVSIPTVAILLLLSPKADTQ